jgi:hypothetical protein
MTEGQLVAVLLLSGHLLADFLVQTKGTAEGKHRPIRLMRHGLEVLVVHAVVMWPFWRTELIVPLVALALAHLMIDAVKALKSRGVAGFAIDQLMHLVVLVGLWVWIEKLSPDLSCCLVFAEGWSIGCMVVGLAAFTLTGGRTLVRLVLDGTGGIEQEDDMAELGARIGVLERLIIFIMILFGQWEAVGFVVAAKTAARFSELKKSFAEYYLIGTLTSVLVAVVTGTLARMFLEVLGVDI